MNNEENIKYALCLLIGCLVSFALGYWIAAERAAEMVLNR